MSFQIHVPDLEAGLRFYRDQLGHEVAWRTERAIGLRLPESDAELVAVSPRATGIRFLRAGLAGG